MNNQETYLSSNNSLFIEELYEQYLENPSSVDDDWRAVFADWQGDVRPHTPSWVKKSAQIIGIIDEQETQQKPSKNIANKASLDSLNILRLIHAYRVRGHLIADLDPLNQKAEKYHPELDPKTYGFSREDYSREVNLGGVMGLDKSTIVDVLTKLKTTYCDKIGVEYMHIQFPEQKQWIQERIETDSRPFLDGAEKQVVLDTLIEIESFEEFLQIKYPGAKRFSIQGGDAAIAGLQTAITHAADLGMEDIVVGMPHRGRLNVLTTIMGKPYAEMFSLFHGKMDFPEWMESSGDVKYHLGASSDRILDNGKKLHLSLVANPSHLEAVNPVACGKVRAKQDQINDIEKSKVMSIMMHGDAAFAGQGSVAETLALSELRGYRTGGSLHFIVNNQIGFTTSPTYSRFTPYPSDVAKMVQAPIFHVNGEDAEAVAYICKLAVEFKQKFKRDVVVDIICYRKYGHNEADEPMFTQPLMYKKIKQKQPPYRIYADNLVKEGLVNEDEISQELAEYKEFFNEQYEAGRDFTPDKAQWLEGCWSGFTRPENEERIEPKTGFSQTELLKIGEAICNYPKDYPINSKLARILKTRLKNIKTNIMDWASGEALAFGSLLKEGYPVRLSGQDCGRGTFSHRHSVLVNQENRDYYLPLNHLGGKQSRYEVIDSALSELAILGFEYGYSLAEPQSLTLWEAQFGDFANGAQVIIDQFISSGEAKWLRMSGLVMLLPHGYEGQGPEHSSARIERYLQLCAEDNMQAINCTTPANYFHALRRQLHRNFRKPLIVFSPKSLLRHKMAVSSLDEISEGTSFKKVITDNVVKKAKRIVICSGKVYYDILQTRDEEGIDNIAIIRLEQYYPFPIADLTAELKKYKKTEIIWAQEEPANMGAWYFVRPYLDDIAENLYGKRVGYAGRIAAASPAAGYMKIHEKQQRQLVAEALGIEE